MIGFVFWETVVALRIERSAAWVSAGRRQPASDYHREPSAARMVDWEALESSSAVLQTAARPSQLPVPIYFALRTAISIIRAMREAWLQATYDLGGICCPKVRLIYRPRKCQ